MATFKVGQRIKQTARRVPGDVPSWHCGYAKSPELGKTGTIAQFWPEGEIGVLWDDGPVEGHPSGQSCVRSYMIAPLTDGESDQWAIDAVRKVTKPQHIEPVAPKQTIKSES